LEKSFSTGTDPIAQDEWILAFMPIHRLSARACEAVAKKVSEGWVGHFEVLLPTALTHCGLRVSDIGGSGAWTPKDRVLRHYVDWHAGLPYLYGTGTLRFRPEVRSRLIKNKLYHPCKTPSSELGNPTSSERKRIAQARRKPASTVVRYWLRLFRSALASHWGR